MCRTHLVQHPLRQDQAIGRHDHHIGVGFCDGLAGCRGIVRVFAIQAQAARLGHGDALRQRELLDRRGLQLHAASGGAVGLGQHQGDGVARRMQALQRHTGKFGRASEDDP